MCSLGLRPQEFRFPPKPPIPCAAAEPLELQVHSEKMFCSIRKGLQEMNVIINDSRIAFQL